MTAGQEDRFSLFLTVEAACQRHQAVWDTDFPAFAQAFAKFQEHVAEIGRLTNDLNPPQDACRSWTRLYAGVGEFLDDLAAHIRLENDVLFPQFETQGTGHV